MTGPTPEQIAMLADAGVEMPEPDDAEDAAEIEANEKLSAAVAAELTDAIDYIDSVVSPERAKATRYYRGEPFGTEEEGRSAHVSTDVRDVVLGMMPNLMRIFTGTERVAEYVPTGPEDIESAEQATDVVHQIFSKQNPGFSILYAVFKDALVRKTGIVKWWPEEQIDTSEYSYSGLSDAEVAVLTQDPELAVVSVGMNIEAKAEGIDMQGLQPMAPPTFDVVLRRVKRQLKYRVAAVPPEEFLIDRRARDLDTASLVAHRQVLTVSDLVAMGYDQKMVEENSSEDDDLDANEERTERNPFLSMYKADRSDTPSRKVLYIESYLRYDRDGDGVAELTKVCTIGSAYKIVAAEGCDEVPFAVFTPDPEPHLVIGLSEADKVLDIQETKSEVMRDVLDSLAQSIHPRTAIVEGQVNLDDVLNNETGAIIRMRAPGMVQPFSQPFVGQAAFPLVEYLDMVKETRTGISKASQGLNADALQSSTRAAVAATISAAQGRIELVARVFAETGLKRMFRGLLRMLTKHQNQPMVVRLRGKFVPIDPRVWNADMDVDVNVALSASSNEERMGMLTQIAAKQEQILQTLGPANPLVTVQQYRHALAKIVELSGFRDASQFVSEIPADYKPPEPTPPAPTPEEILAKVQAQSIHADITKKAAELQLKKEEALRADDRERDKLDADIYLRAAEIQAKYGAQVNVAQIRAMVERDREQTRQQTAMQQAVLQQAAAQQMPQQPPMM